MSRLGALNAKYQKIAVFRALQLGDMLCVVPAFRALRRWAPRSTIVLIGLEWCKALTERFSRYIDRFIAFPGYPGLAEIDTPRFELLPGFVRRVQGEHFDLVIQMHGKGTITNPLVLSFGAARAAGYYQPGEFCPDPKYFYPYPETEQEVWRHLRLLEFLGIPARGPELEFPIFREDENALVAAVGGNLECPYVCLHPGAREPSRRWPAAHFAEVADRFCDEGVCVALTGSAEERGLTSEVCHLTRHRTQGVKGAQVHDFGGKLSLGVLAALYRDAKLVICNDTGVSHLAAALRVPSVVIYLRPDHSRFAPLDRARHRILYDISEVSPARVMSQASELLCAA